MLPKKKRILIVEDDSSVLAVLEESLAHEGYETHRAMSAAEALTTVKTFQPHLVLTDYEMPEMTGLEMLKVLRTNQIYVTVMFISGQSDSQLIAESLRAGADDFILKPFRIDELLARVEVALRVNEVHRDLLEANLRLQAMVDNDDLTGLFNMRSMYEKIDIEIKRARRFGRHVGCVMVDLDRFKQINDDHDHLFGSHVLKEIGHMVKAAIREVDIGARYGGDEFLLVITETTPEGVMALTERLRKKIETTKLTIGEKTISLTASLGYSLGGSSDTRDARTLVREADRALYKAKQAGRNRVEAE